MTGISPVSSWFRARAWLLSAILLLGACQSSQIGPWFQGDTQPRTSGPQSAAAPKTAGPPVTAKPRTQAYPPVVGPRTQAANAYPVPGSSKPLAPEQAPPAQPATTGAAPTAGPHETAALPPGAPSAAKEPLPSFLPYLTRPRQPGEAAASPRSTVPPGDGTSVRVALLLPLSGPNADLGQAMLNAAQMALFDFAGPKFELLTRDTVGTARGAADAATLAIADGARMILGPLLSTSAEAVAPLASAANVPVVTFSSNRSVAGNGVYTMGFLPSAEVNRIVEFARAKGIARFAALAPDTAYGETVVAAYEDAIIRNGGVLARVQFYDAYAEDFAAAVRALADYEPRRHALLAQRRELEGKADEVSLRALKRLENLQTIGEVPFDALLVADGGKRLQSVAALLPFYDIDPGKVRMLGTGQWDEPGIGAEPALLDGWFAAPPPPARSDFEADFAKIYGRPPPRLATLAYDAVALAAVLARGRNGPDFSHQAITVASGFWGRDGIFRFLSDGTAERGLAVMQIKRRGAKIISRAPDTFQARTN